MLGTALAWTLTVGMGLLGLAAIAAPRPMSAVYGAPVGTPEGDTLVRGLGVRDLGLVLILAVSLGSGWTGAAGWTCCATGAIATGDLVSVVVLRGPKVWAQLAVHASGVVAGLLSGALLLGGW